MKREIVLTAELADFIASAIDVGADDEEHSADQIDAAQRICDAIRESSGDVRITVEPIE